MCFFLKAGPCASDPCRNGGTCSEPSSGGYMCKCVPGYTGTNCETGQCKN